MSYEIKMSEEESSPELQREPDTKERTAVVLHESKLEKAFRVICLNGAIVAVGLSLALVGAALPDLQGRTKTEIDEVMKIFVGHGMGVLVGGVASNYLPSQANYACWITFALVTLAVTVATLPSCVTLTFLTGTMFIQGTACGIIKAGCGFICRHHFSRADLSWGRTLFVSFGLGAFLAPVLLLPFTGVATDGTSKIMSMQYSEVILPQTSTVATKFAPARNGVIAPNVLARLYRRRRRDVGENKVDDIMRNGTGDTATTLFPTNATELENELNVSYTKEYLLNQNAEGTTASLMENETHIDTVSNVTSGNVTSQATFNNTSTTTTTVLVKLPIPTTKPLPTKPKIVDGEILSREGQVADSRKFRDEIRHDIKMPVASADEPKTVLTQSSIPSSAFLSASATPTSNGLQSLPGSSSFPLTTLDKVNVSISPTQPSVVLKPSAELLSSGSTVQQSTLSGINSLSFQSVLLGSTLAPIPTASRQSSKAGLNPTGEILSQENQVADSRKFRDEIRHDLKMPGADKQSSTSLSAGPTQSPIPANAKPSIVNKESSAFLTSVSSMTPLAADKAADGGKNPTENAKFGMVRLTKYSYWVVAFVVGLAATSFAFYWVLCPRVYQAGLSSCSEDVQTNDTGRTITASCRFPAFLAAATFHLLYAGLEVSFAILVMSYAIIGLGWSWRLGLLLCITYWGSFLVCRMICSFFFYMRQSLIMIFGLLLCTLMVGGTFLSLRHGTSLEFYTSGALVWVLVGILGFGMSVILPGGVGEIEKLLPHHSEYLQVMGASVGEMILPPVIGVVMTMDDTVWLAYILLAAFVLCITTVMAIRLLVIRGGEGRVLRSARSMPSLEQDDLEDVLTNTNDETELLAKSSHSQTGSPLNGIGNGPQGQSAIQSLMKNISNVKKD